MSLQIDKPTRQSLQLEFSADGYLRMSRDDAEHFFPEDTLLAIWRDESLVLLPTRGAAAGGLMLKRRNRNGDRSLLISEVFEFEIANGVFTARWDDSIGGLRVDITRGSPAQACQQGFDRSADEPNANESVLMAREGHE